MEAPRLRIDEFLGASVAWWLAALRYVEKARTEATAETSSALPFEWPEKESGDGRRKTVH